MGIQAYPALTFPPLKRTYPAPINVKIINTTLNVKANFLIIMSSVDLNLPLASFYICFFKSERDFLYFRFIKRSLNRTATNRCFMLSSVSLSICPFSMKAIRMCWSSALFDYSRYRQIKLSMLNISFALSFDSIGCSTFLSALIY